MDRKPLAAPRDPAAHTPEARQCQECRERTHRTGMAAHTLEARLCQECRGRAHRTGTAAHTLEARLCQECRGQAHRTGTAAAHRTRAPAGQREMRGSGRSPTVGQGDGDSWVFTCSSQGLTCVTRPTGRGGELRAARSRCQPRAAVRPRVHFPCSPGKRTPQSNRRADIFQRSDQGVPCVGQRAVISTRTHGAQIRRPSVKLARLAKIRKHLHVLKSEALPEAQ